MRKRRFKIFFLASEVVPFAKTGGLADVAGALPKVLKEMGHDVRLMMPKYRVIDESKYTLREVIRLKEIRVKLGDKELKASIKSAFMPETKVQVYFLDYKPYFDRNELYRDPSTNDDWSDNAERFIFFCKGALETLKFLHWQPNVIHCNDWQTALVPLFLKTLYEDIEFFGKTHTLLSIHNLAYQGNFDKSALSKAGLPESLFYPGSAVEFYGKFNFLKAGIMCADLLNTVSKRYAEEIQESPEYGCGLEGVLRERKEDLYGILNGIDYRVWNPEVDELIPYKYSLKDLSGKQLNKQALLEEHGLEFKADTPLIGAISRLADQKGFDLIGEIIDEMMGLDIQFILLGTGEEKYHQLFTQISKKYPGKVGINLKFDNSLAHRIEAGCDMFLMPSRYEPCGLNQLYSLKYGTIPIVRATGGLADTIKDFNPETGQGNGFVFERYSSKELLKTVKRAVKVYKNNEDLWKKLMITAMKEDYSWRASAEKYVKLHTKLISRKRK